MQILGKRSKVLLIVISVVMLVAIGVSFAAWDSMSTVKAASGNSSTYANAKVGDEVTFGHYYQSSTELTKKDSITWIVVDKDERTGQLTLLSKYILACGSYFGNYFYDKNGTAPNNWGAHYDSSNAGVGGIPYNQAYVDSTIRAYLNNLERLDLGGDAFDATGYLPGNKPATTSTGLYSSIGFSNQRYWTGQSGASNDLLKKPGFTKRVDNDEIYYQRPIEQSEYTSRPATKGFYDEAFTDEEKAMIVPKIIAGYTGNRWPDKDHDVSTKSFVEGAVDKIWLPSATELNIAKGHPWNYDANKPESFKDAWTNPSDEAGSTVFEYFKNYQDYGFGSVEDAIKTTRTELAKNSIAGNYSIPVYSKGTTTKFDNMHATGNSSDHYWTRSPMSCWANTVRLVDNLGLFSNCGTYNSNIGVRPALILSY